MANLIYFHPISGLLNHSLYLPACARSVKVCEKEWAAAVGVKHQVGTMPGKQRERNRVERWSEKSGERVKNAIAVKALGESADAK